MNLFSNYCLSVFIILIFTQVSHSGDWKSKDWKKKEWSPINKQEAVELLRSTKSSERRKALGRLAEIGTQLEVPYMLGSLWDEEIIVRKMAEEALWGLWLRVDDRYISSMFQIGIEFIQHEKYTEAIKQFSDIINNTPNFAEAWNKRGDAHMHSGYPDKALVDYGQAIKLNPYHFGAMESCGSIWLSKNEIRKAYNWFQKALEINPNLINVMHIIRKIENELENDRV